VIPNSSIASLIAVASSGASKVPHQRQERDEAEDHRSNGAEVSEGVPIHRSWVARYGEMVQLGKFGQLIQ
jgi:hypothetical protein